MSNQSELTEKQQEEVKKIASSLFDTFKISIQTEIKKLTELLSDPELKQYLRQNRPGRAYRSLYEQKFTKSTDTKGNCNSVQKDKKEVKPETEVSNKQEKKTLVGQEHKHDVKKAELHNEKAIEDKKKLEHKPLTKEKVKYPLSPAHQKQKIYKEPKRNLSNSENMPGGSNALKKESKDEKQGLQVESKKTHPPTTKKSSRSNKLEPTKKHKEHEKEEIKKEPAVSGKKSSKDIIEHKEIPKERRHSNAKEVDAEKKVNKKLPEHKEVPQSKEKIEEHIKEKSNIKEAPKKDKANEQKQGLAHRKSGKALEHKEGGVAKKQEPKEEINEKAESNKKPIENKKIEEKHVSKVQEEGEKAIQKKNLEKKNSFNIEHAKELKEANKKYKKIHEVAPGQKAAKKELPKNQELKEEEREQESQLKKDTQQKEVKLNGPSVKEIPQHEEAAKVKEETKVKETKGQRRKRKRKNRERRLSDSLKGVLREPVKRTLSTNYVKSTTESEEAS